METLLDQLANGETPGTLIPRSDNLTFTYSALIDLLWELDPEEAEQADPLAIFEDYGDQGLEIIGLVRHINNITMTDWGRPFGHGPDGYGIY